MQIRISRARTFWFPEPGEEIQSPIHGSPAGVDREELSRSVDGFDSVKLSRGGFLQYWNRRRTEGLRDLYRRVLRTGSGLAEEWVTADEFHKEIEGLLFTVFADFFLTARRHPETVVGRN